MSEFAKYAVDALYNATTQPIIIQYGCKSVLSSFIVQRASIYIYLIFHYYDINIWRIYVLYCTLNIQQQLKEINATITVPAFIHIHAFPMCIIPGSITKIRGPVLPITTISHWNKRFNFRYILFYHVLVDQHDLAFASNSLLLILQICYVIYLTEKPKASYIILTEQFLMYRITSFSLILQNPHSHTANYFKFVNEFLVYWVRMGL